MGPILQYTNLKYSAHDGNEVTCQPTVRHICFNFNSLDKNGGQWHKGIRYGMLWLHGQSLTWLVPFIVGFGLS